MNLYFETYHKLKQYASCYPENFEMVTKEELEKAKISVGKEKNYDDFTGSGCTGGFIGALSV